MSELSNRLSQFRRLLDDLTEADQLVDSIGELLGRRNALRAELRELDVEITTKRRAVDQEVCGLDVEVMTKRRAVEQEVGGLDVEVMTKRRAVEQEVAALDADVATRQRAFAEEIARMEEQTTAVKTELSCAEHELRDVRMRLDHAHAVYNELRKKFA